MRYAKTIIGILLMLLLASCDSFNLFEEFLPNGGLTLTIESDLLEPGDVTALYPQGGTGPFQWQLLVEDSTGSQGTAPVLDESGPSLTAGTRAGSWTIELVDSDGYKADVLVIIRPEPPELLTATRQSNNKEVVLEWDFTGTGIIDGFIILRSDGSSFKEIVVAASPYTDPVSPSADYSYRILAYATGESGALFKSRESNSLDAPK